MTKEEPRIDDELRALLSRASKFKRIADHDTGPAAHINGETAQATITTARRFVNLIAAFIPPNGHATLSWGYFEAFKQFPPLEKAVWRRRNFVRKNARRIRKRDRFAV